MAEKVVGILGGMGPEATADFFAKVIALTPAKRDQDHLRIIINNNPKIPDRTEAILAKDEALFPILVETAKSLERAGVDFIVIPCNTVHYFYEDLVREVSIPILHMIGIDCHYRHHHKQFVPERVSKGRGRGNSSRPSISSQSNGCDSKNKGRPRKRPSQRGISQSSESAN